MKTKKLTTMLIEEAADTQSRVQLSQETIDDYAERILAGQKFPPIDVFFDGARYYIADGWHRFHAWIKAGKNTFEAVVHDGSERAALLFAAGANKTHGLKRSNRDKRRAVQIILSDEEWSQWTNGKVAEHCGVGDDLVADVRRQVSENETSNGGAPPESPGKREGRDGKSYPVKPPKAKAPKGGQVSENETSTGPDVEKLSLPYRESANFLDTMRRKFEALAETPDGVHLQPKIQRLANELNTAKGTIRQAEPLAVCGKCDGSGCQHCARTGWWPRMTVESNKK